MIKKRLLTLADRLESIAAKPPKKRTFNLTQWLHKTYSRTTAGRLECGTVCCAVGEASFIPEFRKLGLSAKSRGGPSFKTYTGWDAAEKFFSLDYQQAIYLFSSCKYPRGYGASPTDVANRIRQFVADGRYNTDFDGWKVAA